MADFAFYESKLSNLSFFWNLIVSRKTVLREKITLIMLSIDITCIFSLMCNCYHLSKEQAKKASKILQNSSLAIISDLGVLLEHLTDS